MALKIPDTKQLASTDSFLRVTVLQGGVGWGGTRVARAGVVWDAVVRDRVAWDGVEMGCRFDHGLGLLAWLLPS